MSFILSRTMYTPGKKSQKLYLQDYIVENREIRFSGCKASARKFDTCVAAQELKDVIGGQDDYLHIELAGN